MGVSVIDVVNRTEMYLILRIVNAEQYTMYEGYGEFVPMPLLNEEITYMQPEYDGYNGKLKLRLEIE